ncbi:septum formation initiator family protein [uncultured Oscillibacter sp.]|uniref:septum formation initiator family protein n=1 Tax=uncultured Oscillibacter sp. TaxID=876091 RepID=UPI0025F55AC8|nr:septum formation initiator family protein [uncultured Oscillibacter sp.]
MAKQENGAKRSRRAKSGLLTRVLLLALLGGIGWQLYSLRDQVERAQVDQARLAAQVEAKQRENDTLSADIAQGGTQEKMEEIAREQLGLVTPGEYVFYDVSN